MPETLLAHFAHHWEAEMARGYLEEAEIPSRLISDNLAGGHFYMGSIAGASLLVATPRLEDARRVLGDAGVLGTGHPLAERPLSGVARADREDLTERLRAARKAEVRHFIRCMLGMTPTAVIPVVGLALEGNVALIALLCVLVVFVEGWKWIRAGKLVKRLQAEIATLEREAR